MFKTKELSWMFVLLIPIASSVFAADKQKVKWTPTPSDEQQQEAAKYQLEQQRQLKKAQQANIERVKREKKVLEGQQKSDWEQQQIERSEQQFSERVKREAEQLQKAQKAAQKNKKIEK